MDSEDTNPMWAVRDVAGRGKGLFATRLIPRGTRILSEKPIITVPGNMTNPTVLYPYLTRKFGSLSSSDREAFLSLHARFPYNTPAEHYAAIIRSVALPIEDADGQDAAGIFPHACRINHACDNNGQKSWNTTINRHTVHAIRDIPAGEEITITYVGILTRRADRQSKLQATFGFLCSCGLCSLPSEESNKKDAILVEILRIEEKINELIMISGNRQTLLDLVKRQVDLYNEFGPNDIGLPRAYFDAAQIAYAGGDFARGRVFAEKALEGWKMIGGDDSPQIEMHGIWASDQNLFVKEGSRYDSEWTSSFNDVPVGMSEGELDGWLWAHATPTVASGEAPQVQIASRMTNLRHNAHFPTWSELPHENNLFFSKYHADALPQSYRPKEHYCFLGEITEFTTLLRLEIHLQDLGGSHGNIIPLYYYTPERGAEVPPGLCKKGNTAAVLYPVQHNFVFGPPGIRLEDAGLIRIFPASLNRLLLLSDAIQQFSGVTTTGNGTCHGCGCIKGTRSLLKCGRCKVFWYCDANCQRTGWNDKGHKGDCKLLRDRDLVALFKFDWDVFEGVVRWPLPV